MISSNHRSNSRQCKVITGATKHKRLTRCLALLRRLTMWRERQCFSQMRNSLTLVRQWTAKTIVSCQEAENVMLIHYASWSNGPSSLRTSQYLQECALEARKGFTSCQTRWRWIQISTWMISLLSSSRTVETCCQTILYSTKMAPRHIRLVSFTYESSGAGRSSEP